MGEELHLGNTADTNTDGHAAVPAVTVSEHSSCLPMMPAPITATDFLGAALAFAESILARTQSAGFGNARAAGEEPPAWTVVLSATLAT